MNKTALLSFGFFIIYVTLIFFLPSDWWTILAVLLINLLLSFIWYSPLLKATRSLCKILPFILIAFIFNWLFDGWLPATFITLKLCLVCQVTFLYAGTISTWNFARLVGQIFAPLAIFGLRRSDVELIICIALSLIPILRTSLREARMATLAKGLQLNLSNVRWLLQKLLTDTWRRIDAIDAALIAKGIIN